MPTDSPDPSFFISKAHLKGFKSIEDVEVAFEKGLNILIGKNGSGKSNFLEFLYQVLDLKLNIETLYNYAKIELELDGNEVFELEFLTKPPKIYDGKDNVEREDTTKLDQKLFINGNKVFDTSDVNEEIRQIIEYKGIRAPILSGGIKTALRLVKVRITPIYIKFNFPARLDFLNTSGILKIKNDSVSILERPTTLNFLFDIIWAFEWSYLNERVISKLSKTIILKNLKINSDITDNLKKYTPIQDIKFNENINIYHDDKSTIIDNLKIDFKINGHWLPWSQLSDGTKRLFYIVAEITNKKDGLVLVEEPELGVHPHQFNLLMTFLKEQSQAKQIIISTHSPYALNCLSPDELNNILLTSYDPKKGTQIKHLTKPQIKKAQRYMDEVGFFSDYWMLSDLE